MVFDTTFCGDFPASSVQLFKRLNMLCKSMKRMNMLLIFENMAYHFRTQEIMPGHPSTLTVDGPTCSVTPTCAPSRTTSDAGTALPGLSRIGTS